MAGDPAFDELVQRARSLAARPGRSLLGIAGAPGAGKSTFAQALAGQVPGAVVVPMDGFHWTTAELRERGWVDERGSPRTFDAQGYVELMRRLRNGSAVTAPAFDRTCEEPVPEVISVPPPVPLVITEGNYLLVPDAPWAELRQLLDEVWFVQTDEAVRIDRLIARHVRFGRSAGEARARVLHGVDAANARLVAATRDAADLVVTL